ncbi:MAG: hypothetical protein EU539_11320 [Promethearchaeota archaeon]|nr:MAG: hypothetical protein EU539_11320 [Candidatus Lokiarchaeota archaeon]
MIQSNFTADLVEKAAKNFDNIKDSIKALYEILLMISDKEKDNFYLEMAEENLSGLYLNLLELLANDYGLRKILKKLKNSEIELDIILDELIAGEK